MRRYAVPALVIVFLVVLAGVGVVAFQAELPGPSPKPAGGTPACSPQPCANVQGYDVWITSLASQNGLVTMQVSFRNASSATHADPSDFELIDAAGRPNRPFYDSAACLHWPRTEFAGGASRGPFPLCFKPSSADPPLRLHWTPDMGVFCCEATIRLN